MQTKVSKSKAGRRRVQSEDALKHLWDCQEAGRAATAESLAGTMGCPAGQAAEWLADLRGRGWVVLGEGGYALTGHGRHEALQVVRKHRLYETWLAWETGVPAVDWHRVAHRAEHELDGAGADALADQMNNPRFDPHGDPIPTREGFIARREATALASWPDGEAGKIEHLEDEPTDVFSQAEALGLAPGLVLGQVRQMEDGAVEADVTGRTIRIPATVVSLVQLAPLRPEDVPPAGVHRLSDVETGDEVMVYELAPSCLGAERRRLLDLGVVPGTRVRCEFASPFGSPRGYTIRGAMIALRDYQAERILVLPMPPAPRAAGEISTTGISPP